MVGLFATLCDARGAIVIRSLGSKSESVVEEIGAESQDAKEVELTHADSVVCIRSQTEDVGW